MTRACLGGVGAKPMVVRTRRVMRGRHGRGLRSLCCVVHWPGVGAAGARGRLEAPQESRDSGGLPHGSRRACSGTTTVAGRRPPTEAQPWPVGGARGGPFCPPHAPHAALAAAPAGARAPATCAGGSGRSHAGGTASRAAAGFLRARRPVGGQPGRGRAVSRPPSQGASGR